MHLYGKPSNIVCNWVIYILCLDLFFPFFLAEKPKVAEKKYFIDTNSIHLPKSNMEMLNPVKDGMSKYWTYNYVEKNNGMTDDQWSSDAIPSSKKHSSPRITIWHLSFTGPKFAAKPKILW